MQLRIAARSEDPAAENRLDEPAVAGVRVSRDAEVIVQTCRSCTSTTPGARASREECVGVDQRRHLEQDRRRVTHDPPVASTRAPMRMLTSASAHPAGRKDHDRMRRPRSRGDRRRRAGTPPRRWISPRAGERDSRAEIHDRDRDVQPRIAGGAIASRPRRRSRSPKHRSAPPASARACSHRSARASTASTQAQAQVRRCRRARVPARPRGVRGSP